MQHDQSGGKDPFGGKVMRSRRIQAWPFEKYET
jgi:hypothetical protein